MPPRISGGVRRQSAKTLAKDSQLPEAGLHEAFESHHEARPASPRAFGLLLAAVCVLIALWPLFGAKAPRWWALAPALLAAALAWRAPQIFAGPNRVWMKLGELLARVVSPIALAMLFYGMFVPLGWLMRATGRNPLRLQREPAAATYWIEREPPGPSGDSLTHPF